MSKCVNEKCNKNPLNSMKSVIVNIDGDMACCEECKKEYKKQRNYFLDNIGNDYFFESWLNGDINDFNKYGL
jgi:hypothetical protein